MMKSWIKDHMIQLQLIILFMGLLLLLLIHFYLVRIHSVLDLLFKFLEEKLSSSLSLEEVSLVVTTPAEAVRLKLL
jgi:hypothetical protein